MNALLLAASLLVPGGLCPQSAAAKRIAREIVETFGREAVERAEPRVARLVEEYGEEAVRAALRRAGPAGVQAIEAFGASGAKVLARWGEDGVRLLALEGEAATRLFARLGEPAVDFMIRHPGVGREVLEAFGARALRAPLTTEGVIALNRLSEPIRRSGRSAEILEVVERFGDRACAFLWRNKGTIFAGAMLASFLADPKPYIDGVKELVVEPAARVAAEAARRTDWTSVLIAIVIATAAAVAAVKLASRKRVAAAA